MLPSFLGGVVRTDQLDVRTMRDSDAVTYAALLGDFADVDWLRSLVTDDDRFAVGAWLGRNLVGAVACFPQWHSVGIDDVFVNGLFVCRAQRGRHVGRALLGGCAREASRRGTSDLWAQIREVNLPSRRVFAVAGYQQRSRSDWDALVPTELPCVWVHRSLENLDVDLDPVRRTSSCLTG